VGKAVPSDCVSSLPVRFLLRQFRAGTILAAPVSGTVQFLLRQFRDGTILDAPDLGKVRGKEGGGIYSL